MGQHLLGLFHLFKVEIDRLLLLHGSLVDVFLLEDLLFPVIEVCTFHIFISLIIILKLGEVQFIRYILNRLNMKVTPMKFSILPSPTLGSSVRVNQDSLPFFFFISIKASIIKQSIVIQVHSLCHLVFLKFTEESPFFILISSPTIDLIVIKITKYTCAIYILSHSLAFLLSFIEKSCVFITIIEFYLGIFFLSIFSLISNICLIIFCPQKKSYWFKSVKFTNFHCWL